MKKVIILLLFLFFFVNNIFSQKATTAEIIEVAKNFYWNLSDLRTSSVSYENISPIIAFVEKRNDRNIYYVVNLPNNNAHVYVTSDRRIKAVLGYGEGLYNVDKIKPPAFINWMDNYSKEIESFFNEIQNGAIYITIDSTWIKYEKFNPSPPSRSTIVAPLLGNICWDQDYPYNNNCPFDNSVPWNYNYHTPVGCVATAMAQIMKYWSYPGKGNGSHGYNSDYGWEFADFGNSLYLWSDMPTDNTSSWYSELAEISYHCGVSVDMDYGASGSSAYNCSSFHPDAKDAYVDYFGYDNNLDCRKKFYHSWNTWRGYLRNDLDNNRPVHYEGTGTGGHSFICDGYSTNDYFHFNWGWGCSFNGNFLLDDLTPGSHNYSNNQGAIFGIEPLPIAAPTGISASDGVYTNAVAITWDLVDYASHYRVYRSTSSGSIGSAISNWITNNAYMDYSCSPGVTYYYRVKAASSEDGNNSSNVSYYNTGYTLVLLPDLIVQNQNASPTTVQAGSTTTLSCKVKNNGAGPTTSSGRVGYYLSTNTTYGSSDILLDYDSYGILNAGTSSNESETVTIPSGTSPGTYYILFYADYQHNIPESNENNNISYKQITVTALLPDLIVQNQNASPTTVQAGSTTTLSCKVKNNGAGPTTSSGRVGYYLSTNTTYGSSDILLDYDSYGILNAGTSSNESETVTIPSGTSPGTYYILFYVDYQHNIPESNENNNISYKQITVTFVPLNKIIQNVNIVNGGLECYDATNTITVAGSGTTVNVYSGGEATFIAGQKVILEPGFIAYYGSYIHAYITTTGDYCSQQSSMVATDGGTEQDKIGLIKKTNNDEITIYPNPTNDKFTIDFKGVETTTNIRVVSFQGAIILETEIKNQLTKELNIQCFPEGMYLIVINTGEKQIIKKIIKNY